MQVMRRVPRPTMRHIPTTDGVEPVGAGDARELRVVKLRLPGRFSDGGTGSMSRVPPMIRTVGAARRIWQRRGGTGRRHDGLRRASDHVIGCCPHGQTEQCSEEHAAEHGPIVPRRCRAVNGVAGAGDPPDKSPIVSAVVPVRRWVSARYARRGSIIDRGGQHLARCKWCRSDRRL